MSRQHCAPIRFGNTKQSVTLELIPQHGPQATILEDRIQTLVHSHPEALPIAEIDPLFCEPIAICREMQIGRGRIDNFLLTASGLPILVECKLWRNPEARREVIGQILEYANTLSRWSFIDIQREVAARVGGGPTALLDIVRTATSSFDEAQFTDSLTINLRRGRLLLLILGDGIREDVETIASYLQAHGGLHFTFGLVEFPIYRLADGEHLVVPRVVVRTNTIVRSVIAYPEGFKLQEPTDEEATGDVDDDQTALADSQQAFWREFLDNHLRLDDRAQAIPTPPRQGRLNLMMPAPNGSSWLTVYRLLSKNSVGVFLSAHRNSLGEAAMNAIVADWEKVRPALGGTAFIRDDKYGRKRIIDRKTVRDLGDPNIRKIAFDWLAERVNTFVNVLRPRIRDAIADQSDASA